MIKKNYRSEIDGLRALAVLPVVFYHAGFELFSGGYVGVDVFFVISGYLITSIILRELNDNTFSLKSFYERRARRILPALTFIIIVSSFFAFIFLTKSELVGYFQSVKAVLLFFSNFYFWKSTPYFKADADLEPLLHTWSLSIEEQFYIVFPITLLFLYKFYKNKIFVFFILVFVVILSLTFISIIFLAILIASSSFSARKSETPEILLCICAPPNSSSVDSSLVAIFTSGGPAKKTLACCFCIIV